MNVGVHPSWLQAMERMRPMLGGKCCEGVWMDIMNEAEPLDHRLFQTPRLCVACQEKFRAAFKGEVEERAHRRHRRKTGGIS